MKLLVATTNEAKFREICQALSDSGLELISLRECGVDERAEETGKTFEENAILKARFYAQKTRLPTLADDGGLEIEALGGWPGIHSHRIEGATEATDEEIIKTVLERLRGMPSKSRKARFKIATAVVLPDGRALLDTESTKCEIPEKPSSKREPGFPYRSITWLPSHKKFFVELSSEEQKEVSHRARLLRRLKPKIVKFLEPW